MKALLRVSSIVMLTILGLIIAYLFRSVIVLFVGALLLTITLQPAVKVLRKLRLSAGFSMVLIYLVLSGLVIGMAIVLFPVIAQELQQLGEDTKTAYAEIYTRLTGISALKDILSARLPTPENFLSGSSGINRSALTQLVVGTTMTALEVATQGTLVLFLSIYLAADEIRFERLWLSVISPQRRTVARQFVRNVQDSIGAYLRSEMIQSVFVFSVLYALSSLIGLNYALIGSALVALIWMIPLLGGIAALAWMVLAGWLTSLPVLAIALVVTIALLAFTEFWLQPRLYRRDRFGSILVLLMMLLLGRIYGLIGLLAAPPLATAIQVALNAFSKTPTSPITAAGENGLQAAPEVIDDAWDELESKLGELKTTAAETDLPPSTMDLLNRLTKLMERTRDQLGIS
jgi:predicted PurR-regulated permease PerM